MSWYVLNSKKNSYPKIFVKIPSLTPWIQQNMLTYTNERNNMDDVDDVHVRQNYITLPLQSLHSKTKGTVGLLLC